MEILRLIPNFIMRAFPNCEVDLGSLLEMTLDGRPNHGWTFCRYNCAIPGPVIVVVQGMKIAALEHPWSTMVSIASFPFA